MPLKRCPRCQQAKPLRDFHKSVKSKDGRSSRCKPCAAEALREWRDNNADKQQDQVLRKKYGITLLEYRRILKRQKGRCAICGTRDPGSGRKWFAVDHCHKSQRVRALLCMGCHCGLGYFQDNPLLLRKAAKYLTERKST